MLTKFWPPPSSSPSLKLETFCSPVLSWNCQFSDPPLVGTITTLTCFFMYGFPKCWWKVWHFGWGLTRSPLYWGTIFGPGGFVCATHGVVAKRSLPLLLPTLALLLAQVACVRHACLRAPCVACPLLSPSFSLSLSLSLFLLRFLLLTHFGESPMCEIIFHPIFWHN